ncbi:MAG: hypothetical protein KDE31_04970, partial [Caldilineaceae bacterium]|nr:hypothetical protein [Caldilineaceae bacterium]
AVLVVAMPLHAFAHPLGNFTINRYSRIEATATGLHLVHIIDMAEIPAHQERSTIDGDHDGEISEQEQKQYLAALTTSLATDLQLTINGATVPWQLRAQRLSFPGGQAGLPTLRVVTEWQSPLAAGTPVWEADYEDKSFAGRLGWQEIVVRGSEGAKLLESTAPASDVSAELTTYPADLLQSPLAVTHATFRVESLAVGETTTAGASANSASALLSPLRSGLATDPFAELINTATVTPLAILLALFAAFGWGTAHAFSPGHGKTVVAAYLVGSRGTVAHALFLGITTTVTHTAGVFALGLVTLFASRYILPETLYPWLSVLSGLLVVAIGISMVRDRWLRPATVHGHGHSHSHEHGHDHPHPHEHGHADHHDHGHDIIGHH